MPEVNFSGLLIVAAVAFLGPLVTGLVPRLRLPSVVLEIVAGIVIGPSVLGWVEPDDTIRLLSVMGLTFLLFLAGLEVEPARFKGRFLRIAGLGLGASLVLSAAIGYGLSFAGLVGAPLLVAIILSATSLGLVVSVLKDVRETESDFGQLTIAGSSLSDFAGVILLSLLFSQSAAGTGAQILLLGGFLVVVVLVGLAFAGAQHSMSLSVALDRLQDTTAQIRVRGAVMLLLGFLALAQVFGLEVLLGAFMAGAVLKLIDRDATMTHPFFHTKLEAIGFGFLIPFFFVTSGLTFDLDSLFASASSLLLIPVFALALLLVRGLPAILYRPLVGRRKTVAAGLLQATSLPFIVAASQIGMELGVLDRETGAALVAAGLVSVLVFPLAALSVLRGDTATVDVHVPETAEKKTA